MKKFGIVAIGYNRYHSLVRLLDALNSSEYEKCPVTLIISLDYWPENTLREYAEAFEWKHGNKILQFYNSRQGLRNHVIQCGNYLNLYDLDAIAVFEDDILPSKIFYSFMKTAVDFYSEYKEIAGISLYSFTINPLVQQSFYPAENGLDTYLMQFPCSWGQIWLRRQWNDFYEWYIENEHIKIGANDVPAEVSSWPETSWLKYFVKYCIVNQKFFVYPYKSFSTNFSEKGTHIKEEYNLYQVCLQEQQKTQYNFCNMDSHVKYDAFFERMGLGKLLGIDDNELCVDLYGSKNGNAEKRYWLTVNGSEYKQIASFGLKMKPHEQNVLKGIKGGTIHLYDTVFYSSGDLNEKLILFGAGKIGQRWLNRLGTDKVFAFADFDPQKAGKEIGGKKILSVNELGELGNEKRIFISTSEKYRQEIHLGLEEYGLQSYIVDTPYMQTGNHIELDAYVDTDSVLEGKNAIWNGAKIIESFIGYGTYVAANTQLLHTKVGRYCSIGPDVKIIRGQHPTRRFVSTYPGFYSANNPSISLSFSKETLFDEYRFAEYPYAVCIGNDVWIGSDVHIMEGVTISDGTIVAAGAVVVKDTEAYSIVGGVPAKKIGERFTAEEKEFLLKLRWWKKNREWIEKNACFFNDIKALMNAMEENQ